MENKKKFILPILSFLIPIILLLIYTAIREIQTGGNFFFSSENYLMADMSSQYSSLYSYLRDVLHGSGSIFYSFSKGLGGNMMSTVGYYLASPLNLLLVFSSKTTIPIFIFMLLLLKFGLCGLFMYLFLSKKFETKSFSILLFSSIYALMGYNIAYYFNNMWFDVVFMTPLILIGLDKLIKNKSPIMYSITLGIAIFSNFYIAYMVCLFLVIYFIYEILCTYSIKKDFKLVGKICLKFIIFSLLGAGLASILLIPAALNLSEIMRFPIDKTLLKVDNYKDLIFSKVISKMYISSHIPDTVLSRQNPNLYSGIITFVLITFYYFNSKIKKKEKILTTIVLCFFFISFLNPYLNLLWHGLSFPNGYVYRFSFVFTLFLLMISCKSFLNLEIKIIPTILMIVLIVTLGIYLDHKNLAYLSFKSICINSVFVAIYIILLFLVAKKKRFSNIIIALVVLVELYINLSSTMITNVDFRSRKMHGDFYKDTCSVVANLENDFYRIDGDYLFSYLDQMICDTKGFTTSLTTNNGDLYRWLYLYGYPLNYTTVVASPTNPPVLESLFGIKYFYSKDVNNDYYKEISNFNVKRYNHVADEYYNSNIKIYINDLALSMGYLIDNNYNNIYTKHKKNNPFEYQNAFVSALIGRNINIYEPVVQKKISEDRFSVKVNGKQKYVYLGFRYKIPINIDYFAELYINNNFVTVLSSENSGIVRIDNNYGDEFEVSLRYINNVKEDNDIIGKSITLYTFNENALYEAIDILKENQMKVEKINGNYVKGSIKVDKKRPLFTSIPYEKGWRVYVDGKKKKALKIGKEWVGVELDKGDHIVEFKFWPRGLTLGIIISLTSVGILIIYKKKKIS